jgi:hypothetical protein
MMDGLFEAYAIIYLFFAWAVAFLAILFVAAVVSLQGKSEILEDGLCIVLFVAVGVVTLLYITSC